MSPQELAAIGARAAESIVWAPGTLASDPAVSDKLWQASQDRRALLDLLRETREALVAIRRKSDPGVDLAGFRPPTDERGERLNAIFLISDSAYSKLFEP